MCAHIKVLFFTVTVHKYIRDKYSLRFPELESLVPVPLEYIKTVQVYVCIYVHAHDFLGTHYDVTEECVECVMYVHIYSHSTVPSLVCYIVYLYFLQVAKQLQVLYLLDQTLLSISRCSQIEVAPLDGLKEIVTTFE